jgi:hypothetical protein
MMLATVSLRLSQQFSPSWASPADVRTLKDITLQQQQQQKQQHQKQREACMVRLKTVF